MPIIHARPVLTCLLLIGLLQACAQAPVPQDHYYRLPDPVVTRDAPVLQGTLTVERLRTDGVYAQRPLLYSKGENGVELHQYHYHYWTDSPPRLLQDHLIAYLRGVGAATTILADTKDLRDAYRLSGRLRRLEQLTGAGTHHVIVEMELTLQSPRGKVLLVKDYRAKLAADNDGLPATVAAFDRALQEIYETFLSDLRQLKI